jgi:DNA-binding NtrC family response regulator
MDSPKVLIVDDNQQHTEILATIVSLAGGTAVVAHSAEDAFTVLRNSYISLVLLDWRLSSEEIDTGGSDVLKMSREHRPWLPVIVVSAAEIGNDTATNAAKEAYSLGADAFIPKPVSVAETVQLLRRWLKRQEAMRIIFPEFEQDVMSLEDLERSHVLRTVAFCDGNQNSAAKKLGVSRNTVAKFVKLNSENET